MGFSEHSMNATSFRPMVFTHFLSSCFGAYPPWRTVAPFCEVVTILRVVTPVFVDVVRFKCMPSVFSVVGGFQYGHFEEVPSIFSYCTGEMTLRRMGFWLTRMFMRLHSTWNVSRDADVNFAVESIGE